MKILTTKSLNSEILLAHAGPLTKEDKIDRDGMIQYCIDNRLQWLALPQIGINKAGFVAYFYGKRNIVTNPVMGKRTELEMEWPEGCASIPWEKFMVKRKHTIVAKYNGEYHFLTYPHSIVFQHEYDHLNGILLNSK